MEPCLNTGVHNLSSVRAHNEGFSLALDVEDSLPPQVSLRLAQERASMPFPAMRSAIVSGPTELWLPSLLNRVSW